MGALGFAIVLGFGGMLLAAVWTFVIGLAGAPGAVLAAMANKSSGSERFPVWALVVTVSGQLYAALIFIVFVITTTERRVTSNDGVGAWVAWTVTFAVATAPAWIAAKDASKATPRTVQHVGTAFTAPLATAAFFVLLLAPATRNLGWGWLPSL